MRRLRTEATGGIYIEALVAIAVLTIALVPIIGTFAITPAAQRQAGRHTAALNIARGRLEELHALQADRWELLQDTTETVTLGGQEYRVSIDVDTPRETGLRDVKVTVSWVEPTGTDASLTLGTSVARRR